MATWLGFVEEAPSKRLISAKKIKNLIRIPQIYQAKHYTCGIASLQSVLYYYGREFRYEELEKAIKPDPKDGTDHKKIIEFAKSQGLSVNLLTAMSLTELRELIDVGNPVIVLIQAWSEDGANLSGSWKDGHYAVAIGYDEENIYLMDPSTLGHYTFIPTPEFFERWHDKDGGRILTHAGIVINSDDSVRYDPNKIKKLN